MPALLPTPAMFQGMRPVKRSLSIAGHRTSITLEAPFWDALRGIADQRGLTLSGIVTEIDEMREGTGLSTALRIYILNAARYQIVCR